MNDRNNYTDDKTKTQEISYLDQELEIAKKQYRIENDICEVWLKSDEVNLLSEILNAIKNDHISETLIKIVHTDRKGRDIIDLSKKIERYKR